MELSAATLGIASEGSFGSDPFTGLVPWNVELLVWVDQYLGIEIAGIAQGSTHSEYIRSSNWEEVADFAKHEGFPRQHLVLRPDG